MIFPDSKPAGIMIHDKSFIGKPGKIMNIVLFEPNVFNSADEAGKYGSYTFYTDHSLFLSFFLWFPGKR